MNKSERGHLEAIQNIEFMTSQIAESKNLVDDNENVEFVECKNVESNNVECKNVEFDDCKSQSLIDKNRNCCSAFVKDLIACESCNKCKVK